jgi:hypothetical protein
MRGFAGYLLIGSLAVLAMGMVTVGGLGLAVGARPVAGSGQIIQYVDRTHKGDRLDLHTTVGTRSLLPTRKKPEAVPVGCEPVFSPLAASARANYSGRCIAEFVNVPAMAG